MVEDTLAKLLKRNYEKYGDTKVAMRFKDRGVWKEHTWHDYYEQVKYFSLGLIGLSFERGDRISIIGENKPQWFWAQMAAQAAGGVAVGIYTDCGAQEVKYFVTHSDSKFVIAHDQEQVDKVLQIKDELPLVKRIIYWDPKGLWSYDDPLLMSFDEVVELGKGYDELHPQLFEENMMKGGPDDIALFAYTSGTSGLPKATVQTQEGMGKMVNWWQVDKWHELDQYVSFIPPAWATEQALGVFGALLSGMEVNFVEKPETVQENIREIGPSVLFFGTRLWESVVSTIQAKIADTTPLKRSLYYLFLPICYKVADIRLARRKPNWLWRILYAFGGWLVFDALKDKVGLSRVRCAYTAGSAISPDILRYFQGIGVNIKQLYGGTEQGTISLHRDGDIKWETSGGILPGVEVRLTEQGEMLTKGGSVFVGYHKNPEATEEIMKGGWFHSGDFGYVDEDGHIICIDRMEDLRELSGGRKFSPQYTEIRLRFSPYIKDVVVVGSEDRAYVTAIINIDLDNVGRWAEVGRIPYTTYADLSQKPEIIDLIRKELLKVNKTLPEWARVKKFGNLHKEFDADEAELTRTRKIRRTFVEERYGDIITALYTEDTEYAVETPIAYRDGRTGVIKTAIKLNTID